MNVRRTLLAVLCCALAAPAWAQDESGAFVSAAVSAATIGDGTPVALSGGVGYRLNRSFGFGVEVTVVPSLTPGRREIPTLLGGSPVIAPIDLERAGGHAVVFTTNMKFELPTSSSRILPYVIGGGGIGVVREQARARIYFPPLALPPGSTIPVGFPLPTTYTLSADSTDLALTIGGGISFVIRPRLSIDAEGRYISLLGSRDFQIGRFGAGVTGRF